MTKSNLSQSESDEIQILLATYQGARFLQAQLDSIAAQSHTNWRLVVSDDGSRDATRDLVREFARQQGQERVELIEGPRKGATQNFLNLIHCASSDRMLAFCDQDDVWHPEKLARAAVSLSRISGPAHYAARTTITDQDLRPVAESRRFSRPLALRNALVQACMAGNTSVFNRSAAALLKAGVRAAQFANVESHDWWAYQLTSGAGATLIHDPAPALLYRQHGAAEMGRNDTTSAMVKRLGKLFAGDFGRWVHANLAALTACRDLLTPDSRTLIDDVRNALTRPGPAAAYRLHRLGLYRQTRAGTVALLGATASGRLR